MPGMSSIGPHCTMQHIFYGQKQVVQLFLEHGADVNARDKLGKTPSELGSQNGFHEIVELLSAYVAKSVKR